MCTLVARSVAGLTSSANRIHGNPEAKFLIPAGGYIFDSWTKNLATDLRPCGKYPVAAKRLPNHDTGDT
jgi:hypothetical protein